MFSCFTLQVRRAGALAVTKAVADKAQLELLDLDANEISDSAVDDIKVQVLSLPAASLQQACEAQCLTAPPLTAATQEQMVLKCMISISINMLKRHGMTLVSVWQP